MLTRKYYRGTGPPPQQRMEMTYEDLLKTESPRQYSADELTAVYFYMNLTGNLGVIRTLVKVAGVTFY